MNTTEIANFALECESPSDKSTTDNNCIEKFDDSSDNDNSNDGMLKVNTVALQDDYGPMCSVFQWITTAFYILT